MSEIYSIPAFREARSMVLEGNLDTNRPELLEAFDRLEAGEHPIPDATEEETAEFIDSFKAERYAKLAIVIDDMVDIILGSDLDRTPQDFRDLHVLAHRKVYESVNQLHGTAAFAAASKYSRLVGTLDPRRHINLRTQLQAGGGTAVDTMVPLIENIPKLAEQFCPTTHQGQCRYIVDKSVGLAYTLAKRSVVSMMAAREIQSARPSSNSGLDPTKFRPVFAGDQLVAITHKDLDEQQVPAGFDAAGLIEVVKPNTSIKELEGESDTVIGCPITLLSGRLTQLWKWMAEHADKAELWLANSKN